MKKIDDEIITLEEFKEIFDSKEVSNLQASSIDKLKLNRNFLEKKIEENKPIYGINTGFGSLYDKRISDENLSELQRRLVLSHAVGMGNAIPREMSRLIMLLKIRNLSLAYSGVRVSVIERLIDLYNRHVYPIIYEFGSLGASGDLAPLAHLALILLGEGKVWFNDEKRDTIEVLNELKIEPIKLRAKEGLALLNGTQFSTAYLIMNIWESKRLLDWANMICAASLYSFNCQLSPFNALLHKLRPHPGQLQCAEDILSYLNGCDLAIKKNKSVQDPYSFRCVPQVHGATYDTISYVNTIAELELNSVTDNPSIFHEEELILSGGNFHAQPIALALDFLGIAMSEIGSISERRIYQLTTGQKNLPTYLVKNPGLNSGIMIAQYTAASITSKNKQLCTPSSADSIVSSLGQEDHVSMAANAGTKLHKIVDNVKMILSIELFAALQGFEFRDDDSILSPQLEELYQTYRKQIPPLDEDRYLHQDLIKSMDFIDSYEL